MFSHFLVCCIAFEMLAFMIYFFVGVPLLYLFEDSKLFVPIFGYGRLM